MQPLDGHAARHFLEQRDDFALTSHVNGDGDGIGSCLALDRLLRKMGKKTTILLPDEPDRRYQFLDGWQNMRRMTEECSFRPAGWIVLDCPVLERIGAVRTCLGTDAAILNIDHHQDNRHFGTVNLVSTAVSSTSELLYQLMVAMKVTIDPAMATQLYTGILFDTGGFRYSSTSAATFSVAAALAGSGIDLEGIADRLFGNRSLAEVKQLGQAIESLSLHLDGRLACLHLDHAAMQTGDSAEAVNYGLLVEGVEAAVLLKEESPRKYRISLRSRGRIDVAHLAAHFGGGGHCKAAGCRLEGARQAVETALFEELEKHLNQGG